MSDGSIVFHVDASGQHGLAVQPEDKTIEANWVDAIKLAKAHGRDWRLPTKYELNLLYEQKSVVDDYADGKHWCSTEDDINFAWSQSF